MMGSDLQERDLFDETILAYLFHKRKNHNIFLFSYNKSRQDLSRLIEVIGSACFL